jgi:stage II sporulation protein D
MFLSYLLDMKVKKIKRRIICISIFLVFVAIYAYSLNKKNSGPEPYIELYLHEQGKLVGIDLEQYIKGTVAAEMPASFEIEALRAQAVCARTYAIKKLIEGTPYPKGADLSDDINACQAYVPLDDFATNGSSSERRKLLGRIEEAVDSTRGEIMLYNSMPIDALYSSTCGGRTESAVAVWGRDLPYLRSVNCGDCEESSHYQKTQTVSNEIINKLVGGKGDSLKIKVLARTPGGRPKTFSINQQELDAVTLRKELKLDSNWIEFVPSAHSTIIKTQGYGHGVGLCQYGSNGMAQRGKDYHQILQKYYSGITFYNLGY